MVVGFEPTRPSNSLPGLVNVDFNHSDHRLQYRTLPFGSASPFPPYHEKKKQDTFEHSVFIEIGRSTTLAYWQYLRKIDLIKINCS